MALPTCTWRNSLSNPVIDKSSTFLITLICLLSNWIWRSLNVLSSALFIEKRLFSLSGLKKSLKSSIVSLKWYALFSIVFKELNKKSSSKRSNSFLIFIPLAEIVIELALSPKSNSAVAAIDEALNDVRSGNVGDVPKHLRNPSNDYKYPHLYKNDYVRQQYLPDVLLGKKYYHPKENKNEKILKDIMDKLDTM